MTIVHYELCGADTNLLFSPHCWKTRYAMAHKGLDYETVPTPFTQVATLEGGENRTIPVIRDGDTVMHESYDIACYLEKAYPDTSSLFGGDGGKAVTRLIIDWSQTQLHPAVARIALMDIHNALAPEDQIFFRTSREKLFGMTLEEFEAKFPKNNDELNKVLTPLQVMLSRQPFIGGESPLFADYVVFGALQWLRTTTTHGVGPSGRVETWFETLLDMYDGLGRKALTVG